MRKKTISGSGNGSPVVRYMPDKAKVCTGRDLARILADIKLSDEESAVWRHDLKAARKMLIAPADKWQ